MAVYLRQCFVDEEFAKKAPAQGVILREVTSYYDQEGKVHVASIVQWYDTNFGIRYGAFDAKTGEYLGDHMGNQ